MMLTLGLQEGTPGKIMPRLRPEDELQEKRQCFSQGAVSCDTELVLPLSWAWEHGGAPRDEEERKAS